MVFVGKVVVVVGVGGEIWIGMGGFSVCFVI